MTFEGVTFSQISTLSNGNLFHIGSDFAGTTPLVSSQEQTAGVANILVTLPELARAITIKFGTFNASAVTFTLSSGAISVLASTSTDYATDDLFVSGLADPFISVLVTTDDSIGLNISSVSYTTGAVPEPAAWGLMLLGAGVTGAALRRRRTARTVVSYA